MTMFREHFEALAKHRPFPWQEALYERFVSDRDDHLPEACDIPTGLGKTSVIAIWLLALAKRPDRLPRRLVYVVNRRTVVDQTTTEVKNLRDAIEERRNKGEDPFFDKPLAISTLRGQFADNREWSADPTRPAVICGTVDMIGSRLLFSGYGIGYKQRPMHAGFLGQDVLLVHDEAHLEQPFQSLLKSIQDEQTRNGDRQGRFHVMQLSATVRESKSVFTLTPRELRPESVLPHSTPEPIHHVWQRLTARKAIQLHAITRADLVSEIGTRALARKDDKSKVLIFVQRVADVEKLQDFLTNKKNGGVEDSKRVALLTGTLRGLERDQLVETPVFRSFLDPELPPGETVYLVCTSAGEVGIDISADHMLCDLTPLDSLAQRLGRVNRRGTGNAEVDLFYETDPDPKQDSPLEHARWKTLEVLRRLGPAPAHPDRLDGSPLELRNLKLSPEDRTAAYSPTPQILPTSDILFDAWSLTTIRGRLPGRPPVEPYVHGVAEWQPAETRVAWRLDVEFLTQEILGHNKIDPNDSEQLSELFAEYPLKPHEILKDRSDRVFKELELIARRHPKSSAWLMDDDGAIEIVTLDSLADKDRKQQIERRIVLLPPHVGGLTTQGTLSGRAEFQAERQDYDVADRWLVLKENDLPHRKRVPSDELKPEKDDRLRLIRELILRTDEEMEAEAAEDSQDAPPVPPSKRFWRWYVLPQSADDDGSKTAKVPIKLQDHVTQVARRTREIVETLSLPQDMSLAIGRAADLHDMGKTRRVWQRSIGNPNPDIPYAKSGRDPETRKLWKPLEITRYRHELGSLVDILRQREEHLDDLPEEMQDLLLHLVAAHHGRARPHFPPEESFDPEAQGLDTQALTLEAAQRFARLQRRYGRWGLAYLESLLRAADWEASAKPDESPTSDTFPVEDRP